MVVRSAQAVSIMVITTSNARRPEYLATDVFRRFLSHVERLIGDGDENEQDSLDRGWF